MAPPARANRISGNVNPLDQDALRAIGLPFPQNPRQQTLRRRPSDQFQRLADGRQADVRKGVDRKPVDADDGHIPGYPPPGFA